MSMIRAEKIVKTFGFGDEKVTVLNEIDLEVGEGEFVAIMGPSGSGKSTLLYALSAIENIDSGNLVVDQTELNGLKEDDKADFRRKKFGFVFQNPTMLKNLNVLENILLQASYDNRKDRKELAESAKELMKKTGINGLENRSITEVSGGQLQRAGICRAILHKPRIVFADEPTGALDSKSGDAIMDLFTAIHKEGMTIILVTHDSKVASVADKVIFMKDGEIKEDISLKSLSKEEKLKEIEGTIKRVF